MVKMMKKRCLQPPNPPRYSLRKTAHAIRSAEYPTLFAPPPAPLIEAVASYQKRCAMAFASELACHGASLLVRGL